ncbi:GHKL domain-containing protein [[Ruminococcus] gnavus]|nr:GHKL domain-containing protein [Mediterraneibacter gnavus]
MFSTNILKEDFAWTVVILAKSLTLLFMLILNKIIGNIKNIRRMTEGLPIVLSSLPFLIVMVCLYIIMPQAQNNTHRMLFLICDICVFGLFIASIFFTEYYISIQQEKREEEAALYELKVKSDYYLKKTNIENEIRQIYHDLKNHFLLTEESKTKEEILKKLSLYETYCETGNDFLNVILSEKLNQAQKKGIRIECDVDFSQGSFLLPLDISTIFGNLLDNAIEACLRIEDDEPYIFVSCKARGNMISVVIKNSMISNSFGLKTTKKDKHFHGYGLGNVKKALEDYNGEMFIKAEGTEFLISLIIPIPKEIQSEKSNFK